jgi:hypothetical protein
VERHVAQTGKWRGADRLLVGKGGGESTLEKLRLTSRWKHNIIEICKKYSGRT